jgi:hypothetical protein
LLGLVAAALSPFGQRHFEMRSQRMLQSQHRDIVGGETFRLFAQPSLVPFMAAIAVLVPYCLVEPFHRAEAWLALDQLGNALPVDCRIAEVYRMVEKDGIVRSQAGDFLEQSIECKLVVTRA